MYGLLVTPTLPLQFQIIQMEHLILQTLDFNLVAPTSYNFLQYYLKAAETEQQQTLGEDAAQFTGQTVEALAMYLCELAMQDSDRYLKHCPSVIAVSAVCLTRHTVGQLAWVSHMISRVCLVYAVLKEKPQFLYCTYMACCIKLLWPPLSFPQIHTQPSTLQHYSGYSVVDIGRCLHDLHKTFAMAPICSQQAIRQKYASQR